MRPKANKETSESYFWNKVDKNNRRGCWLWTGGFGNHGYGVFSLLGKTTTAHRASFYFDKGYLSNKFICHSCDNRKCVRPSHLFEGSADENNQDMAKKGRTFRKLSEEKVFQILVLISIGMSQRKIARIFGVTQSVIRDIKARHTWRYV